MKKQIEEFLQRLSKEQRLEIKQRMQEVQQDIRMIEQGLIPCYHPLKLGDNYGQSCETCDQQLEGYGYNGKSKTCLHKWGVDYTDDSIQHCRYCQRTRPKSQAATDDESGTGPCIAFYQ